MTPTPVRAWGPAVLLRLVTMALAAISVAIVADIALQLGEQYTGEDLAGAVVAFLLCPAGLAWYV